MKAYTFCFALLVQTTLSFGQGQVNFANDPALFVDDPNTDRLIHCDESLSGRKLSGSNWAAQLWYGIGFNLPGEQLTMVADPVAHFFPAGTGVAGAWDGGLRTLPGTTPGIGQVVTMQVRIWDTTMAPTYFDALRFSVPHAPSDLFNYTVPADNAPPDAFLMYGFHALGFECGPVPEPGTWALFAMCAVFGCWCGRRKTR